MKDLNLNKEINQLKKISLKSDEKDKILHNLSMYADFHMPINNTYSPFNLFINIINKKISFALASILIAILTGGTVAYASEQSLPGDLLYPVKTNIVEPIQVAIATTPEKKAAVETKMAEARLNEAEKLDKAGKLTPKLSEEINKNFDSHVSNFYKIKNNIEDKNSTSTFENRPIKVNRPDLENLQNDFDSKMVLHTKTINKFDANFWKNNKISTTSTDKTKKDFENLKNKLNFKDSTSTNVGKDYKKPNLENEDENDR